MKKLQSSQKAQKIRVKVCGAETVTNNRAEQTIANAKSATGTFTLQLSEYQADIVSSDTECPIIAYSINQLGGAYTGSLVTMDSSTFTITFSLSTHYTQQQFEVVAWSEGVASGYFVIKSLVYVCNEGADIVALFKAQCCNNQIFVWSTDTLLRKFVTSATTHTETSADIKALFEERWAGCVIEKFELYQNGALYTGTTASIDATTGQLTIDKSVTGVTELQIRATGFEERSVALKNLKIVTCGTETVTNSRAEQTITNALSATGTFTIQLSEYQASIVSSDTECPVVRYELRQNNVAYSGSLVTIDTSTFTITFSLSTHYTQQQFQVYAITEAGKSDFFLINSMVYDCSGGAVAVGNAQAQCCNNKIFILSSDTLLKKLIMQAGTSHTETSADIKALFDIQLAGCTIDKFELIQNGALYTGTTAQIDATTGQLTIDKSVISITELQIKAYGFQDLSIASKPLKIVVCGPGQNYLQLAADQVVDQTVTITTPSQVPIYLYKDAVNTNLECEITQTTIEKISTPSSPASDNSDIQIEAITGGKNFKFADGGMFATNSFKITTEAFGGEKLVTQATLKVIPQFANYYLYPSCKPGCISSDGNLLERAIYYVESTNVCWRLADNCLTIPESQLDNPEGNAGCLKKLSSCSAITLCADTSLVFQKYTDSKAFEIEYRPQKKYSVKLSQVFDISPSITSISFVRVKMNSGSGWSTIEPTNSDTNQLTSLSTINLVGGNTIEIEIHEEHATKLETILMFKQNNYDCFMDSQRQYFPFRVKKNFEFTGQTDHNQILQNNVIVQSENFASINSYPLKADLAFAAGTDLTDMTFHMHELNSKFNFLYSKDYDTSSQSLTVDKVIKIVNKPSEPKIIYVGVQIESKTQQTLKDLVFKFTLGSPTQSKMQLVQSPIEFKLIFKTIEGEQYQKAEFNYDLSQLVQGETALANILTKVSLSEAITSYNPTQQDITTSLQILDQYMEAPPAVSIKFDSMNRKLFFKIARSFTGETLYINLKFLGGIQSSNTYDSDWLNIKIGVCNQPSFTPHTDQSHRKIYQYSSFMQNDFQFKVAYDNTGTHLDSACFSLIKDHSYVEEPATSVGNSKDTINDSSANAFIQISTSSVRKFQYNLKTTIQLPSTNTLFLPSELTVVKEDTIKTEVVSQDQYSQATFVSQVPSDQIQSNQYDMSSILKLMECATIRNCDRFIHLSLVREDTSNQQTFSGKIFKETSFDLVKISSIGVDTNIITFEESLQKHQYKIVINSIPTDMQADPVNVKSIIQISQTLFKAFLRTEFSPITVSISDLSERINFLCNQESASGECTDRIIIGQLGNLNPLILSIDLEEQPSSYWIGRENKAVWIIDDQVTNQLRWKLAQMDYKIENKPYCECKSFKWYFQIILPHDPSRVLKLQVSSSTALGQNIVRQNAPSWDQFGRYNPEKSGFFILEVNILDIFVQTHAFDEMVVVDILNENQLLSNSSLIEWYFNGQLNHLKMNINDQLFNIEQKLRLRHKAHGFQSVTHSIYPKYCYPYSLRMTSKEVTNQTFILIQSMSEFVLNSAHLQKWYDLSEIPQNQKDVCLTMRLLDQNCQKEVPSYSQIKFKTSRIEDKESLRVIQDVPFNLRQYCFEVNSRSGVSLTLFLNFAVCTKTDPQITEVIKPIEVLAGTSVSMIDKDSWIENFVFEQPECAVERNYTLEVDEGYRNTVRLDEETSDIMIDSNSPDIQNITETAEFKFRTYAWILGGVKYTNEYTVIVSVIQQTVEVEEFPETFIKNWFQNQTIRMSFNLTAQDTEANEESKEQKNDPIIQEQSLYLIDKVIGRSEVIAPVSKDPAMKQKLQDYELKLWFIIKIKDGVIIFNFDNSTIPVDERIQLIQSGLEFNVTVKYDKTPYKYRLDLSFRDESKSDEASAEQSQAVSEESSNKTSEAEKPNDEKKGQTEKGLLQSNITFQVSDLEKQKQLELLERQKREKEQQRQKLLMEYGFPKVKFKFKDMKISIDFNQPMNIPVDQNGRLMTDFIGKVKVLVISASDAQVNIGSKEKNRRLQQLDSDSILSFGWYVAQWSKENVEIELRMENPEAVSTQGGYDMMALIIDDLKLKSNLTGEEIDLGSMKNFDCGGQLATFCRPIQPIISDQEQVEAIQSTGDVMEGSVQTILGSNMAITLLVGGSLQKLWGLIRSMQYINMLALVNVMYPPNAFMALQITNGIASLDVLDGENFHDERFEFKETEPLNPNFEAFGTENLNFILNSGSLMLILFYMILTSIIFAILNQIARFFFRFYVWRWIGVKVYKNDLKYQLQIFLLEGYIDLGFASVLNMLAFFKSEGWSEFTEFFADIDNLYCSLSALVSFAAVITIPFYVLYTLTVNFQQLHQRKSRKQFGHFFEGLHIRSYHSAIYQVYFMLKRLTVILTIILIQDYPYFQVMIFINLTMLDLCYVIAVLPFKKRKENIIELINQLTILLWTYSQYVILNYSIDNDARTAVGWFIISLCGGNMVGLLIDMMITSGFYGYKSYVKNKLTRKAIALERKQHQNRQQIVSLVPGAFNQFEYQLGYLEAIEVCKRWKPQRDWLIAMKVPYQDLPEELQYQKLMKMYKFAERREILFKKYTEGLQSRREQAEKRKSAIVSNVQTIINEEKSKEQKRKSLSIYGKDPRKIMLQLQGSLQQIDENSSEHEENIPIKAKETNKKKPEEMVQIKPLKRPKLDKIISFGEQAKNDLKKLKTVDLDKNSIFGKLVQDELQVQEQIEPLKNADEGFENVNIDFMNESDVEEFEIEENFKSKFDFVGETDYQIVADLKKLRRNQKPRGNGIVGLQNLERKYSHVNALAQCLLALNALREWKESDKMTLSELVISQMLNDVFSVSKSGKENMQFIVNLSYLKSFFETISHHGTKKIKNMRNPHKFLNIMVQDELEGTKFFGQEQFIVYQFKHQVGQHEMSRLFSNLLKQNLRCLNCQCYNKIYRRTTGIYKLESEAKNLQKQLSDHFGSKKDRKLQPTDNVDLKKCQHCNGPLDSKNQLLNIDLMVQAPIQVIQIERNLGQKKKYYKEIDVPLEIEIQGKGYELKALIGFPIFNPHGDQKRVLEHFVAYTLRDTQLNTQPKKDMLSMLQSIGQNRDKHRWIEFDDEQYRPVTEKEMLNFARKNAYMLFYVEK